LEVWRDVVGYEGKYQVSDLGSVKSLSREVPIYGTRFRTLPEKILSVKITRLYPTVGLSDGNVQKTHLVHRLVADAFLGPKPSSDSVVRHLDDIKIHCFIDNLAWGTRSDNQRDRWRNAKRKAGYNHHMAKLSLSDNVAIKVLLVRSELGQDQIAKLFGVCPSTISKIAHDDIEYEVTVGGSELALAA
jgi:hypothetical protein